MTRSVRQFVRVVASFRYPAILCVLAIVWLSGDRRMENIVAGLDTGLNEISRLEEASRLENELSQFYTTARKFARGDPEIERAAVIRYLDLAWARVKALTSESYANAIGRAPERKALAELDEALPQLDAGVARLTKGDPQSYETLRELEYRFSGSVSALSDWAYAERRSGTNIAVNRELLTIAQVRAVQNEYLLVIAGGILFVMGELLMYWLSNKRLARLVGEKRSAMRSDYLTGILNRMSFEEELAKRGDDRQTAVIFFDLDGFKKINDTLGHAAGDALLRHVANILQTSRESQDVVARFGGDEFAALVFADHAAKFATAVITEISKAININGAKVHVTVSAGICSRAALATDTSPDDMMRYADLALYAAKREGKNCFVTFSNDLLALHDRRMILESDLEHALRLDEIDVAFQPIMALKTNQIVGIEALVRWNHPALGTISPLEICDVARNTGQMLALTLHVMAVSCRFRSNLHFADEGFRVSINVSPELLNEPLLPELMLELTKTNALSPRNFVLEITELSADFESDDRMERSVAKLQSYGFRLAVDDFGTGQSNLVRLSAMDFRILKLDKCLIEGLQDTEKDVKIVGAISRLATEINLRTVAEGVETNGQMEILRQIGIDYAQGYLISAPLSPVATLQFMIEHRAGLRFDNQQDPAGDQNQNLALSA